tara:strand:- start:94 stop:1377 length:1284 start_codon:yes stop_codon:yes gene_type:complete
MGGGTLQLVAYGKQDETITGNPQITFFKMVYRRHTNFSIESMKQLFFGDFEKTGVTNTCKISKVGDLLGKIWLQVQLPTQSNTSGTYTNWTNNTGHAFIKECDIEIGGTLFDKHHSQWLDIWNELTDHQEKEYIGLNKHKAKHTYLRSKKNGINDTLNLYIPLHFWFCKNPGLALPLISLQYHDVTLKLITRSVYGLINGDTLTCSGKKPVVDIYADYYYLDVEERKRFAQSSHEYLLEQVQQRKVEMQSAVKIDFTHPIKELIWVIQHVTPSTENITVPSSTTNLDATKNTLTTMDNKNDYFNYSPITTQDSENYNGMVIYEHFSTCKIQFNNTDRISERKASYFRMCQPLAAKHRMSQKHIYCYSFALDPGEQHPTGTCNFSRIDKIELKFTTDKNLFQGNISVYALNYNVLRISSGMAGLAYSN